jgi:hypothetical protein
MSILKQVLADAWSSFVRRSTPEEPPLRQVENQPAPGQAAQTTRQPSGLKVVILNWKAGENDPFTVINETMRQHFRACGKNVEVIEITEEDWPSQLAKLAPIEFAFTWQGLGSAVMLREIEMSLWDHLRIPLICVHGDHPCHMPKNHELESRYCFHLYTNADFARYSNRHFRRARGASVIDIPQVHREPRLVRQGGEYFVIAKNINDPQATERSWRDRLSKPVFDVFMGAAETLKARIAREAYVELHDVLDEVIVQQGIGWLTPEVNVVGYHDYHSQLDHYLRSHKAVTAVTALHDFPLHIYGRGWDQVARGAPPSHVFEPGRNMADSQEMYYSKYGLIDISPSKALHDRTRRAMANATSFLSSANLEDSFENVKRFRSLFFTFRVAELPEKCLAVMHDPESHLALAQEFASLYHERFHYRVFVNRLSQLATVAGCS